MLQRKFNKVESDAFALIQAAKSLSDAYEKGNEADLVQALDANLTLWVAIKSFALDKKHSLAQETKNNLIKLSDFVAARTLKMAQNIDKKTLYTFINNNLLIADGLLENAKLSVAQEDAFALINSSLHLSSAKDSGDEKDIAIALDDNMQLWIAIKTMVNKKSSFPKEIKANIIKMADYMVATTLKMEKKFNLKAIDTMAAANLQIAEGLLAGGKLTKTEEDAFALLQAAINLSTAKESKKAEDLVDALEENISIWVSIKTYMKKSNFAKDIKDNLLKLSDFMVGKSISLGKKLDYKSIDVLVNTNLQICEGLLERVSSGSPAKKKTTSKKAPKKKVAKKSK